MLQCAKNFSNGYGSRICSECKVTDDESHRINDCVKWRAINLYESDKRIEYSDIYSNDNEKCHGVVSVIMSMWDLESGKNEMRQCNTE